ncbi:hypothetical protein EDD86DRAFT_220368 [Gorgonomyces haynaldii]|nr:hypothetical protein EDD86DRAFT_220368 [Gorgonomyces haynaldii]
MWQGSSEDVMAFEKSIESAKTATWECMLSYCESALRYLPAIVDFYNNARFKRLAFDTPTKEKQIYQSIAKDRRSTGGQTSSMIVSVVSIHTATDMCGTGTSTLPSIFCICSWITWQAEADMPDKKPVAKARAADDNQQPADFRPVDTSLAEDPSSAKPSSLQANQVNLATGFQSNAIQRQEIWESDSSKSLADDAQNTAGQLIIVPRCFSQRSSSEPCSRERSYPPAAISQGSIQEKAFR